MKPKDLEKLEHQEVLERLEQKREEMTIAPEVETLILSQLITNGHSKLRIHDNTLVTKYNISYSDDIKIVGICKKYNLLYKNPNPDHTYYLIQFNPKE